MFQPEYKITDKILNSIVKISEIKADSHNLKLDYEMRSKLNQKVKSENLLHLGHMLNMNLTLKDAAKLAEGRKLDEESERAGLIYSVRNVLEFNRSGVADEYSNLSTDSLLHINKVVIAGWKKMPDLRFREANESLDGKFEDWINYRQPTAEGENLLRELRMVSEWYQTESLRVNELIRLSVFVFKMVELMPFFAGNKYTTLGVVDLVLCKFGYLQSTYYPIMKTFDQHEQEFWKMWDLSLRSHDVTPWIEGFLSTFSKDLDDSFTQTKQTIGEHEQKNTSQPFLDLNKRQLKILRYLQNIPTVRRDDYCQMMDVSTMTAYRDLNDLVSKKLIKVEGQGRGTRYKLGTR